MKKLERQMERKAAAGHLYSGGANASEMEKKGWRARTDECGREKNDVVC